MEASGESSTINPRDMDSAALAAWLTENGQSEAGAAALEFPLSGGDFSELVASGEGKGALEELGVTSTLHRHKLVKLWQQLMASVDSVATDESSEPPSSAVVTAASSPSEAPEQNFSLAVFFR